MRLFCMPKSRISRRDVRILATDIDTDVLRKASPGVFSAEAVDGGAGEISRALSQGTKTTKSRSIAMSAP